MQFKELIPGGRNRKGKARTKTSGNNPLASLRRDINGVFEDFWGRFERTFGDAGGVLSTGAPRTDVSETDEAVEVSIDLPGMDEKDIEVSLTDDVLTVQGERKEEKEDKKKGYYLSERSYGSIYRRIPLPAGVDTKKADARFKKGVLTVTLPKTAEAREKVRKIQIKSS